MKTTKSIFAILIIAFVSLFNNKVNAQNPGQGTSCSNPISIPAISTGVTDSLSSDSVRWYSVLANNTQLGIHLIDLSSSAGYIQTISIYSSCLTAPIAQVTVTRANQDSLILIDTSLTAGSIYYIKLLNNTPVGTTSYTLRIANTPLMGTTFSTILYENTTPLCGLNYAYKSLPLNGRWNSSISYAGPGQTQPANYAITGMPTNNVVVLKAYVIYTVVNIDAARYNPEFYFNAPGVSPSLVTANVMGSSPGSTAWNNNLGPTPCYVYPSAWTYDNWFGDYNDTYTYYADVTSAVQACSTAPNFNGNYVINGSAPGLGLTPFNCHNAIAHHGAEYEYDVDGATLVIIYQQTCANYQATFVLQGGLIEGPSNAQDYIIGNVNLPGSGIPAGALSAQSGILMAGDVENDANDYWALNYQLTTIPSVNAYLFDAANNNLAALWNTVVQSPSPLYTTGETTIPMSLYTRYGGDAMDMVAIGAYYAQLSNSCSTSPNVTILGPYCTPATLTANATGGSSPYSYMWSNGETTSSISGLSVGTYSVTVTSSNGCSPATATAVVNPSPTVHINGPAGCISSPTLLTTTVSGGSPLYHYSWSPGGQTSSSITINPPAFTSTYIVTVTDKNGCTATAMYTAAAAPSINISPNPLYICNLGSGTATLNIQNNYGNATYSWSAGGPPGGSMGGPGSYMFSEVFNSPGIYTVTVSGLLSGCTSTASITVKQDPAMVLTPYLITSIKCNGDNNGRAGVAVVTGGQSPYSYSWSNGETTNPTGGLSAGTYTVIVTDKIGCTATASITITQPSALNVTMNSTPSCDVPFNGTATAFVIGGTPGYIYSWSNGATTSTITALSPGNYTVHVQDANGCRITGTIRVGVDNGPIISISGPPKACNPSAIYTATASGGLPPYSYSWSSSNGNTGSASTGVPNFNPATGGTITWVVKDRNGCSSTDTYTVTPCCTPGSYPIVLSNVTSSSLGAPPYNFNNTSILIDGTFTVDQNTNFNACDVQFTSNAVINVTNNAELQIVQGTGGCSHLHAANGCCMWQGIIVNPGCELFTTDETLIEDAEAAVTSVNSGAIQGVVDVEFSFFNKNYEDIVFAGSTSVPSTSTILNCVFTCRDLTSILPCPAINSPVWETTPVTTLLCPHAGQYTFRGIDVSNQNSLTITPGPTYGGNIFDNLHCAIYSVASNITVYNNTFQNIAFNFLDVAINCQGASAAGGNSLTVGGFVTFPVPQPNTFTNCYNGIYVHDYMTNVNILQNTFNNTTVMGFGIEEARSNLAGSILTIEKNMITNSLVGIECLNNLNTLANINYNNVIDNLSPVSGTEIGIEASEVSHPVNALYAIEQNVTNVLNYGIYTNSLYFPRIQQNSVTLGIGIVAPPAAYSGMGVYATNCISPYIVNNNPITTQAFSIANTPAAYIGISESSCSTPNIECNTVNDATTQIECIGAATSFGSQVVENNFNIPNNTGSTGLDIDNYAFLSYPITGLAGGPGDNLWSAGSFICRSTVDATSMPCTYYTSQPATSFWDPAIGIGSCTYPNTSYSIPGAPPACPGFLPPPPPVALRPVAKLQSPFNSLPKATTSILEQGLVNTLWTNIALLADSTLHHFNDSIMLTSLGQIMQADTLLGDSSAVDLANTLAIVKSIAPASNIEGDMQTVAEDYLTYRITNSLSASDIRKLRDLAKKCPFKDGLGVYQARALLTFFDPVGTIYIDDLACEKSHRAIKGGKGNDDSQYGNSITINVYPNPANTLLNVQVNLEQGEVAQICLYNSLGQLVQCQELQGDLTTLPTSSLSSGLYFYRILDTSGTLLKADKQMIIH